MVSIFSTEGLFDFSISRQWLFILMCSEQRRRFGGNMGVGGRAGGLPACLRQPCWLVGRLTVSVDISDTPLMPSGTVADIFS